MEIAFRYAILRADNFPMAIRHNLLQEQHPGHVMQALPTAYLIPPAVREAGLADSHQMAVHYV